MKASAPLRQTAILTGGFHTRPTQPIPRWQDQGRFGSGGTRRWRLPRRRAQIQTIFIIAQRAAGEGRSSRFGRRPGWPGSSAPRLVLLVSSANHPCSFRFSLSRWGSRPGNHTSKPLPLIGILAPIVSVRRPCCTTTRSRVQEVKDEPCSPVAAVARNAPLCRQQLRFGSCQPACPHQHSPRARPQQEHLLMAALPKFLHSSLTFSFPDLLIGL